MSTGGDLTAPKQTLVERVARAIGAARVSGGGNPFNDLASRNEAQAAIDACHAEEMLAALKEAVAVNELRPPPYRTRMPLAYALVAKLDGEP